MRRPPIRSEEHPQHPDHPGQHGEGADGDDLRRAWARRRLHRGLELL